MDPLANIIKVPSGHAVGAGAACKNRAGDRDHCGEAVGILDNPTRRVAQVMKRQLDGRKLQHKKLVKQFLGREGIVKLLNVDKGLSGRSPRKNSGFIQVRPPDGGPKRRAAGNSRVPEPRASKVPFSKEGTPRTPKKPQHHSDASNHPFATVLLRNGGHYMQQGLEGKHNLPFTLVEKRRQFIKGFGGCVPQILRRNVVRAKRRERLDFGEASLEIIAREVGLGSSRLEGCRLNLCKANARRRNNIRKRGPHASPLFCSEVCSF